MIDAVGNVSSVLLVGGGSDLGHAVLTRVLGPRLSRVALAGRPSKSLTDAAARVRAAGVPDVNVIQFDATDRAGHEQAVTNAFSAGDIDAVIMAVGWCPDPLAAIDDPSVAARCIDTNLTGMVSVGTRLARALREQGHGSLVWFTAAAAPIPTATESAFCAAQVGLDSFALSLAEQARGTGSHVVVLRLGQVATKLGYRQPRTMPMAEMADVANATADAIRSGRDGIGYVPQGARGARARLMRLPPGWRRHLHRRSLARPSGA